MTVKGDKAPINNPMTVHAEKAPGSIGTIALPTRDHMASETVISLMMSDFRWADGKPISRVIVQGSQLPLQRNECVKHMQGDWLLFIDDDMVFGNDAIGALVATYYQLKETIEEPLIVGGLCVRRAPPHQPTMYVRCDDGAFNFLEDWEGDLVEVDATGAAFYLIEKAVFEAIMGGPMPTYEERQELTPWPYYEWIGAMGEDLRFCDRAQAAGARIVIDTRIRVGHLSERAMTINDFWFNVANRPEWVTEQRKAWNDTMGLPTMDRERALERLNKG